MKDTDPRHHRFVTFRPKHVTDPEAFHGGMNVVELEISGKTLPEKLTGKITINPDAVPVGMLSQVTGFPEYLRIFAYHIAGNKNPKGIYTLNDIEVSPALNDFLISLFEQNKAMLENPDQALELMVGTVLRAIRDGKLPEIHFNT